MKKITTISLILIFLMSNVGLSFGTHYCSGEVVFTKVLLEKSHLDCGMLGINDESGEQSKQCSHFSEIPCCENVFETNKLEDNFLSELVISNDFSIENQIYYIDTNEVKEVINKYSELISGGIPPPYVSNYIRFLSSILE